MADPIHIVCPACDSPNRAPAARDPRGAKCGRCKAALFTGAPIALTGERFRKHVQASDIPLVVDFWAGWCGPKRQIVVLPKALWGDWLNGGPAAELLRPSPIGSLQAERVG